MSLLWWNFRFSDVTSGSPCCSRFASLLTIISNEFLRARGVALAAAPEDDDDDEDDMSPPLLLRLTSDDDVSCVVEVFNRCFSLPLTFSVRSTASGVGAEELSALDFVESIAVDDNDVTEDDVDRTFVALLVSSVRLSAGSCVDADVKAFA